MRVLTVSNRLLAAKHSTDVQQVAVAEALPGGNYTHCRQISS